MNWIFPLTCFVWLLSLNTCLWCFVLSLWLAGSSAVTGTDNCIASGIKSSLKCNQIYKELCIKNTFFKCAGKCGCILLNWVNLNMNMLQTVLTGSTSGTWIPQAIGFLRTMGRWLLHLQEWEFYLTAWCWVLARYYCLETSWSGAKSNVSQVGLQDYLNWWGSRFSVHQLCCKEDPILNIEPALVSRSRSPGQITGELQHRKCPGKLIVFLILPYLFSCFIQEML